MTSRARLWTKQTGDWEYETFEMIEAPLKDTYPVETVSDRFKRNVRIVADSQRRASLLPLTINRIDSYLVSEAEGAGSTYNLAEYLRAHVRNTDSSFYLYLDAYGTDSDGVAVTGQYYFFGQFGELPPWLFGLTSSLGHAPQYLTLPFMIDHTNNQGEGTFLDFDDAPDVPANLVPRVYS